MKPLCIKKSIFLLLFFCILFKYQSSSAKKDESNVHVIYVTTLPYKTTIPFFFETKENIDKISILFDNYHIGQVFLHNKMATVQLRFNSEGMKEIHFRIYANNKFIYSFAGVINISKNQTTSSLIIPTPSNNNSLYSDSTDESVEHYSESEYDENESSLYKNKKESFTTNNKFINEVIPIITNYCQQYHLPTSVIVAMAVLESGYGTSELAIRANNYFGLKDWSVNHQEAILYEKQEEGNWYKKFNSKEECIGFFIKEVLLHQTGKWKKNYTAVTNKYQADIANGVSKESANMEFVEQLITHGYSTLPIEEYSKRIIKIISLYQLSLLD